MSLSDRIGKKYFFIGTTVLFLITVINYSDNNTFNLIRMNSIFSGFIADILLAFLVGGLFNYSKFKK